MQRSCASDVNIGGRAVRGPDMLEGSLTFPPVETTMSIDTNAYMHDQTEPIMRSRNTGQMASFPANRQIPGGFAAWSQETRTFFSRDVPVPMTRTQGPSTRPSIAKIPTI
jgi:hypothetical protein